MFTGFTGVRHAPAMHSPPRGVEVGATKYCPPKYDCKPGVPARHPGVSPELQRKLEQLYGPKEPERNHDKRPDKKAPWRGVERSDVQGFLPAMLAQLAQLVRRIST